MVMYKYDPETDTLIPKEDDDKRELMAQIQKEARKVNRKRKDIKIVKYKKAKPNNYDLCCQVLMWAKYVNRYKKVKFTCVKTDEEIEKDFKSRYGADKEAW